MLLNFLISSFIRIFALLKRSPNRKYSFIYFEIHRTKKKEPVALKRKERERDFKIHFIHDNKGRVALLENFSISFFLFHVESFLSPGETAIEVCNLERWQGSDQTGGIINTITNLTHCPDGQWNRNRVAFFLPFEI